MTRQPTLKQRLEAIVNDMVKRGIRLEEARDELEALFLRRVLSDFDGNQSKAAAHLQVHRNTLRRRLERHGLL